MLILFVFRMIYKSLEESWIMKIKNLILLASALLIGLVSCGAKAEFVTTAQEETVNHIHTIRILKTALGSIISFAWASRTTSTYLYDSLESAEGLSLSFSDEKSLALIVSADRYHTISNESFIIDDARICDMTHYYFGSRNYYVWFFKKHLSRILAVA